ncbi:unnamed protein product [Linum trigynum]|uniref:Uncharacterized protein n=1 Tax=Linum trigynum TaxID=586398 RepID=A0AAV2D726_9ROSI
MLSTSLEGTPSTSPAPTLFPSDRPSDPITLCISADASDAHQAISTEMLIDASAGVGPLPRDNDHTESLATAMGKEAEQAHNSPSPMRPTPQVSYASAVVGWKPNMSISVISVDSGRRK